jgi:hypothetical protein
VLTQEGVVDLVLLGHVQPGPVSERRLKKGQQSTLEDDGLDFLRGSPLFAGDEVGADVHKVLDLLVP